MEQIGGQAGSFEAGVLITPFVLWLGFALVFGVFAIISAILLYHWHKYTFDRKVAKRVMTAYFSVSGIFILSLIVTLLVITL